MLNTPQAVPLICKASVVQGIIAHPYLSGISRLVSETIVLSLNLIPVLERSATKCSTDG